LLNKLDPHALTWSPLLTILPCNFSLQSMRCISKLRPFLMQPGFAAEAQKCENVR
jgi:hypothetical protein